MRRKDREIRDLEGVLAVVEDCRVLHLGMRDGEEVYVLPLSFGFSVLKEGLELYFHCAREGKKNRLLGQDPRVAFQMDCGHCLVPAPEPCRISLRYRSAAGRGLAEEVTEPALKARALQAILRQQAAVETPVPPEALTEVAVYRIRVTEIRGKQNLGKG